MSFSPFTTRYYIIARSVCACVFVFHPFYFVQKEKSTLLEDKLVFWVTDYVQFCIVAIKIAFFPLDNKCVCAKFRVHKIVDTNSV